MTENDARLALIMTLQCTCQFNIVAVVGIDRVSTDQQQDDVRAVELIADPAMEFLSGIDQTGPVGKGR